MKLRNRIGLFLFVALIGLVIAGMVFGNQYVKAESKPVKLLVWGGVPPENGPQDVIDAFMKQNPDIKVEYFRYVNDDQGNLKLDTSLMGGEDIDVYFTYFDDLIVKRVQGGVAEDLTPYLKKERFSMKDNFGDGYFTIKNKIYSLPTAKEFIFTWANKNMFDKAKIAVPTAWTYDEYRAITQKLTKTENGLKIYGGYLNWNNVCENILHTPKLGPNSLYQKNGTSNFTNPIFKDSINYMADLMVKDKSHISILEAQTSKLAEYSQFLNQQSATTAASLWIARYINDTAKYPHDFKTVAIPFPTFKKGVGDYGWTGLNNHIMMNKNSKNKEAAWKFIKFWATEGQIYMCRGGKLPSWKKINQDEVIKRSLGPDADKLYDVESFKRVLFDSKVKLFVNTEITAYPQIKKVWKEEVEKVIGGQQDVKQAVANAKRRADQEISNAKNR